MTLVVVGANGKIASHLHPILIERGHKIRGIIRKEEQAEELRTMGVVPVVCDVETTDDISEAVGRADAVLFAAGAGPGSGAERKWTVDRDGAIKLIRAAKKNGISRYLLISAMGLDKPRGSEVFQIYQKAKAEADEALKKSGLEYTILKPGRLTDEPGTGKVALGPDLARGEIPREDVALTLAHLLEIPETSGLTLDLVSGHMPVEEAVMDVSG